jgi:hypothetical protein
MGLPAAQSPMSDIELPALLINVAISLWNLLTSADFWLGALVSGLVIAILWLRRYQSKSISVGLPFGLGSMIYDTTPLDRIIAWKLYIQLVTRKAALPFDEEHDLIKEVYASLFELFGVTRDLLIELPLREFQRDEGLASLMLRVLNDGIRPHLTIWQSDFTKWWEIANTNEENHNKTPHQLQSEYPRYQDLVAELKQTNTELSKFADELLKIASGRGRIRVKKISPQPPSPEHPPENIGNT